MPISINISGESAQEVKVLVSDLASVVFGVSDQSFPKSTSVSTVDEVAAEKDNKPETPKQDKAIQSTSSDGSDSDITIESLRALAQEKNKAVGSAKVREVLAKYGGLPKAKPEQYAEIKEELESL